MWRSSECRLSFCQRLYTIIFVFLFLMDLSPLFKPVKDVCTLLISAAFVSYSKFPKQVMLWFIFVPRNKEIQIAIRWSCWSVVNWCGTQQSKLLIKPNAFQTTFNCFRRNVKVRLVLARSDSNLFLWLDQEPLC